MGAAKKPNKRVPLSDIINEEAVKSEQEEMGRDMAFDPDRDLSAGFHGPRAFSHNMRDQDQLVIDELLASLPKNQGYYLKLYREILPGKYEYKDQINNYETWTDMELEIAEYVKAMTRKFGSKKWGSGLYRVVIWRQGGIREKNKYPPTDIIVDAGDEQDAGANTHTGKVDPVEAANEQLNALGNMLSAVKAVLPGTVDPNIQFQSIVQAFTAGKEEKREAARQDNNAMMTMMTTMMTSMMGLVTTMMQTKNTPAVETKSFEEQMASMMAIMKSFGFGAAPQPKTIVEQLAEMKMLGFDPTHKEDTVEQIAKLKAMTGALVDIIPQNGQAPERPGIFEKLIDSLAPHVPKIFSDIKSISENAALAQQMQQLRIAQTQPQPEPVPMDQRPRTSYGQPVGPDPNRMGAGDAFGHSPDMDPYSGFQMRPFQDPTESDAGIREEMTGSVGGATPEELRERYLKSREPKPAPTTNGNGKPPSNEQVVNTLHQQAKPTQQEVEAVQLPPMLQQLYALIMQNYTDAYGGLFDALSLNPETAGLIEAVQKQEIDGDVLVSELRKTGFAELQQPEFVLNAKRYLGGFVRWILENTVGRVNALCPMCSVEHIFDSPYEFAKADKKCGLEKGGKETCEGMLELVVHAQS